MQNFLKLLTISLLLSACTTVSFVRKDFTPVKQGVLRHSPPSSSERAAEYREKVNKEARDFCGGEFQITKEYQARELTGTSTGVGTGFGVGMGGIAIGGSTQGTAMYNFVEFTCAANPTST